jgi:murein DD-endopeptidase MepM/ murein hydrolase activator NlpD
LTFEDFTGYNCDSSRSYRDFLGLVSLNHAYKGRQLGTDASRNWGNMIKLNLNLAKYRLDIKILKRRKTSFDKPLLPKIQEVKSMRSGNKVSRIFRYVFEHKSIKQLLGTNLALILLASSFIPTQSAFNVEAEKNVVNADTVVPLTTDKGVQYPTNPIRITQGYTLFHPGVDLDGITGDPIKPIMAGTVEAIQESKYAYGNAIIINHGNEITSLYAHLSKILVKVGEDVTTDTIIGKMGATGRAFGDHLHLEVRDHNRPFNPFSILLLPKI